MLKIISWQRETSRFAGKLHRMLKLHIYTNIVITNSYASAYVDCQLLVKQKNKTSEEEQEREPYWYGRSLITSRDKMCFWQRKSRISDKWS